MQTQYKLILGDALDRSLIDAERIDLTVTSPPYNVGVEYDSTGDNICYDEYLQFTGKWLSNVLYWTKSTGRLALNIPLDKNACGKQSIGADLTAIAKQVGWKYRATIVWNESNISKRTAWGSFQSASSPCVIAPVELIVILYKHAWKRERQGQNDITKEEFISWTNGMWTFSGESKKRTGHPTAFPRELPKRCIKLFSFANDTILDPFLGSGTTLIEAIKNKRNAIGIEISEKYRRLAQCRIKSMLESC